jgi:hypothetical protein
MSHLVVDHDPAIVAHGAFFVGEVFGEGTQRPLFHLGLRFWAILDRLQIDSTIGNRVGTDTRERASWRSGCAGCRRPSCRRRGPGADPSIASDTLRHHSPRGAITRQHDSEKMAGTL